MPSKGVKKKIMTYVILDVHMWISNRNSYLLFSIKGTVFYPKYFNIKALYLRLKVASKLYITYILPNSKYICVYEWLSGIVKVLSVDERASMI